MKKKMRFFTAVFMTAVLAVGMTGCAGSGKNEVQQDVQAAGEESDVSEKEEGEVFCFSGTDVNGQEVDMAEIFSENKVTVVNLWASWCGPCVGELPELETFRGELESKGCSIVGLLIDGEDPQGLSDGLDIISDTGVSYLNVICPGEVQEELMVSAVPTTYFVDSSGKIMGDPVIGADPDAYRSRVDEIIAGLQE
ncbi:MAG: TlpA family protein disulfide reductase [Lachnospiraceae bacterium]|nr:TlpA family protein disulfide reductase [Lachnospiraceae bacterium]